MRQIPKCFEGKRGRWIDDSCMFPMFGDWLITVDVVLVVQGVPALYLLVLVLQALVPVLQPLSLGSDAQLASTYHRHGPIREGPIRDGPISDTVERPQRILYAGGRSILYSV